VILVKTDRDVATSSRNPHASTSTFRRHEVA
jgi:hypothetical protein